MSIAFDSFWWWRAEFEGRPNSNHSDIVTERNDSTYELASEQTGNESNIEINVSDILLSYEDISNWHWPAGLTLDGDDHLSLDPL